MLSINNDETENDPEKKYQAILNRYTDSHKTQSIKKYSPVGIGFGLLAGISLTPPYLYFGQNGTYNLVYSFTQNEPLATALKHTIGNFAGIFGAFNNWFFVSIGINKIALKAEREKNRITSGDRAYFILVSLPSAAGAPLFIWLALSSWKWPLAVTIPTMIVGEVLAAINNQVNINLMLQQHLPQLHWAEGLILSYRNKYASQEKIEQQKMRRNINRALEILHFGLSDEKVLQIVDNTPLPITEDGRLYTIIEEILKLTYPKKEVRAYRNWQLILTLINTVACSYYWGPGTIIGKYLISLPYQPFNATPPDWLNDGAGYVFGGYLAALNTLVQTQGSIGVLQQITRQGSNPGLVKLLLLGVTLAIPPAMMAFLQAYFLDTTEGDYPIVWSMTVAGTALMQNLLLGAFGTAGLLYKPKEDSASFKRTYLTTTLQTLWQKIPALDEENQAVRRHGTIQEEYTAPTKSTFSFRDCGYTLFRLLSSCCKDEESSYQEINPKF